MRRLRPSEKNGGSFSQISQVLRFNKSQSRKALWVLTQAVEWARCGLVYDGERKERVDSTNMLIGKDSLDMLIIADAMEGGFGLRLT